MKITSCKVLIKWADGTVDDVSSYLPAGTWHELEQFMDYWEEQNADETEEENENLSS